jgi:hypothetical protein
MDRRSAILAALFGAATLSADDKFATLTGQDYRSLSESLRTLFAGGFLFGYQSDHK